MRRAEIDVDSIAEVGHSFADRLFRGFAAGLPALELVQPSRSPRVVALLEGVRATA